MVVVVVLDWFGLVWFGLVWFGLVWVGLGWVGLGWVGLGWVGLGWVGLCLVGLGWVGSGRVGSGRVGSGRVGLVGLFVCLQVVWFGRDFNNDVFSFSLQTCTCLRWAEHLEVRLPATHLQPSTTNNCWPSRAPPLDSTSGWTKSESTNEPGVFQRSTTPAIGQGPLKRTLSMNSSETPLALRLLELGAA